MANASQVINVGVIGCGRWGPNHIRVFSDQDRSQVLACADTSEARLAGMTKRFGNITTTTDYRDILDNDDIQAVVIATPTDTHFEITRSALDAGKHVLVEKPLCVDSDQALELADQAYRTGQVLMVGHVFLFNSGILKMRDLIDAGELGKVQYLDAVRTNLGPIRGDVNALYDLATHDISIINYLVGSAPVEVSSLGGCITQKSIEDVCFTTLKYADGTLGHIHVSWLNPRKVRTMTVVGEGKMAHWDDLNSFDPVRVYDKGVDEMPYYDSFGEFKYLLRSGDVHLPSVRPSEPLVNQANAFLDWVIDGKACASDAKFSLDVVRTLEAAMASMKEGGALRPIASAELALSDVA